MLALLTPEQAEHLKNSTVATVSAILPNAPWKLVGLVGSQSGEMPVHTRKKPEKTMSKYREA